MKIYKLYSKRKRFASDMLSIKESGGTVFIKIEELYQLQDKYDSLNLINYKKNGFTYQDYSIGIFFNIHF